MTFAYVSDSVVNMRKAPSLGSEVVSQALFAEKISLLDSLHEWMRIQTPDGYSGWILKSQMQELSNPYVPNAKTSRLFNPVFLEKTIKKGPVEMLPFGVRICQVSEEDSGWVEIELLKGKNYYIQKGNLSSFFPPFSKLELVEFSRQFLNIPYVWGGRSSLGFDCSGFVQFLYSHLGILLPRDSFEQAADSRFHTILMKDLLPADLVFWGHSETQIKHVGMYIGNERFIHTSVQENKPWLRVSLLSDPVWSGESGSVYPFRIFKSLR